MSGGHESDGDSDDSGTNIDDFEAGQTFANGSAIRQVFFCFVFCIGLDSNCLGFFGHILRVENLAKIWLCMCVFKVY